MTRGKLTVAAELGCVVPGASGGLVNVVAGALNELFVRRPDFEFVVFCTELNRRLIREGRLGDEPVSLEIVTLPSEGFYDELDLQLPERDLDVLFRGYPTLEEISTPWAKQIVLMPDLLHDYRPEFFSEEVLRNRQEAFRQPLEDAGAIATISNYARSTIVRVAGRTPDVFVMYPSVPPEFAASSSADVTIDERALVPGGEFFLYPANLWPHKNHDRLLQAVSRCQEGAGRPIELVLTGALEGWEELLERNGEVTARRLGYVSAPLLRLLYERATALTFFSLHEGFGIPLLEAFATGTPVLCSNGSSLPEVAGDAALMCDPNDVEAMAALMGEIASSAALRELLAERGKARLELFSWSNAADQLGAAIERVHARDPGG